MKSLDEIIFYCTCETKFQNLFTVHIMQYYTHIRYIIQYYNIIYFVCRLRIKLNCR